MHTHITTCVQIVRDSSIYLKRINHSTTVATHLYVGDTLSYTLPPRLYYNNLHGEGDKGLVGQTKATQTRFTVYRQHFSHIPSGRAVIIHYSLVIFFKIMSHAPQ